MPGVSKPGGFTITSAPSRAQKKPPPASASADGDGAAPPAQLPYLELAVQKSPDNPAAQYLWRPTEEILSSELRVRVGGSFVWPPPGVQPMVSEGPFSRPRRTRRFPSTAEASHADFT